jgi:pSer/pThr/pTyr-binding forkhead associated (FHA) protein
MPAVKGYARLRKPLINKVFPLAVGRADPNPDTVAVDAANAIATGSLRSLFYTVRIRGCVDDGSNNYWPRLCDARKKPDISMIDAKLVLVGDEPKPTVIKLKKLPMTIGRGKEADLTLAHPMVSRLHCEFYDVEETLCIRDLGSLNGTFVGDIRVNEAALESGDQLTIGSATFKLVLGNEPVDDELMPPSTGRADEFTKMSDSESLIDVDDDKPASKEETEQARKPASKKKDAPAAKKESTAGKKSRKKSASTGPKESKETKQEPKTKGDAETITFKPEPVGSSDEAADDDDDLNDFLSSLQ